MPQVHVVGELQSGTGFGGSGLYVQYRFCTAAEHWHVLHGDEEGFTQVDSTGDGEAVWNHPLDIHYGMDSFKGWPRLQVQVWQLDAHDRSAAAGYGMCAVPLAPGAHDVVCVTWRPRGTFFQRLSALFLGAPPQLEDVCTITSCADRTGLRVESCGIVRLHLEVITAGMAEVGARLGSARGCLT